MGALTRSMVLISQSVGITTWEYKGLLSRTRSISDSVFGYGGSSGLRSGGPGVYWLFEDVPVPVDAVGEGEEDPDDEDDPDEEDADEDEDVAADEDWDVEAGGVGGRTGSGSEENRELIKGPTTTKTVTTTIRARSQVLFVGLRPGVGAGHGPC